jgi:hypothetical protein
MSERQSVTADPSVTAGATFLAVTGAAPGRGVKPAAERVAGQIEQLQADAA